MAAVVFVQVAIVAAFVSWWAADAQANAPAVPASWEAVVHDAGSVGVHLRTRPAVMPETGAALASTDTHLQVVCGLNGDAVSNDTTRTTVWLRTDQNLYVSALYLAVPGRTQIPSCPEPDLPLLPITTAAPPQSAGGGQDPAAAGSGGATNASAPHRQQRGCASGCPSPVTPPTVQPGSPTARPNTLGTVDAVTPNNVPGAPIDPPTGDAASPATAVG